MQTFVRCSLLLALLCAPVLGQQTSADYQRQIDDKKAERNALEARVESLSRELSQARRERDVDGQAKTSRAEAKILQIQSEVAAQQKIIDDHKTCDVANGVGRGIEPAWSKSVRKHNDEISDAMRSKATLDAQLMLARSNLDAATRQGGYQSQEEIRLAGEVRKVQADITRIGGSISSLELSMQASANAEAMNKAVQDGFDRAKQAKDDEKRREEAQRQEERDAEDRRNERRLRQDDVAPDGSGEGADTTPVPWTQVGLNAKPTLPNPELGITRGRRAEDIFLPTNVRQAEPRQLNSPPISVGPAAIQTLGSPGGESTPMAILPTSQLDRIAGDALAAAQDAARNVLVEVLSSGGELPVTPTQGRELETGAGAVVRGTVQAYMESKWLASTRDILAQTLYGQSYESLGDLQRNDMVDREAARGVIAPAGDSHSAALRYWDEHVTRRVHKAIDDLMGLVGK